MTSRYWTGQRSSDFGDAANWEESPGCGSPASSPPGAADVACFPSGGVDCRLDADATIGGLASEPGYTGRIDMAGCNLTGSPGADFLMAHSGDFSLGTGTLRLDGATLDWSGMGGKFDRGTSTIHASGASVVRARDGDRLHDLLVDEHSGTAALTIGPGALIVHDLTLRSCGASAVTLDAATHSPKLTIEGDLTFVSADAGTILIDRSGAAADWVLHGDVSASGTSSGGVQWRRGGGTVTAAGNADQHWDWSFLADRLEEIVIDKGWGCLTLTGDLACVRWTHRRGIFDPGGRVIDCQGDFTVVAGARMASSPSAMDGCSISVGGDLALAGKLGARLRLLATVPWTLSAAGAAAARLVEVAHCDATGGTIVDAANGTCIDGGANSNWRFAASAPLDRGRVRAASIHSAGPTAGGVGTPGGPGKVFTPGSLAGEIHG